MAEQAYTYCNECGSQQVGLGLWCHNCGERWTSWGVALDGERVGYSGGFGWKTVMFGIGISLAMWAAGVWVGWRLLG